GEARELGNLGYAYVQIGLYKQGRIALEQALALNQAIGMLRQHAYNLQNLGLAYLRLGDGRKARQLLEQSLQELAKTGDNFGQAASNGYLAFALENAGDAAGAVRRYREAGSLAHDMGTE